jgi:hypothetical protein
MKIFSKVIKCCKFCLKEIKQLQLTIFRKVDFFTSSGDYLEAIPSLSAILTSSAREPAPIFSITWWR